MKIGIMGGTFDPVHRGHLEMALYCQKQFQLDRIMFLPVGDAPHKPSVTGKELRLKMLEAAVRDLPDCFVSRLETDRPGKTYTFDSLTWLRKNTPHEYFYIVGGDTVNTLHTWFRARDVFSMTTFLAVARPHVDMTEGLALARSLGARVLVTEHEGLDSSSTAVRENVRAGKSIRELIPEGVEEVIRTHGLYQN